MGALFGVSSGGFEGLGVWDFESETREGRQQLLPFFSTGFI